jgi:hypothetical protein
MCTILLRLAPDAGEPVVLAANRDEFRGRPADGPTALGTGVFGGRDRLAGGTWLAIGPTGLAAVTNLRDHPVRPGAMSRGTLPLAALAGTLPADYAAFNAFNLLIVDRDGARVLTHRGDGRIAGPVPLGPGNHVIVNEPFALPGGLRAQAAAALLGDALPDFRVLSHHGGPAEPDGSLCRHGREHGTVSSTVVALDRQLGIVRYLHREGPPCTAALQDLTAAARRVVGGP